MKILSYLRSNRGQGFVEYLFIIGLIALMIFVIIQAFGNTVGNAFNKAGQQVTAATKW
jgi:Flp pilus assembly pilin Flp